MGFMPQIAFTTHRIRTSVPPRASGKTESVPMGCPKYSSRGCHLQQLSTSGRSGRYGKWSANTMNLWTIKFGGASPRMSYSFNMFQHMSTFPILVWHGLTFWEPTILMIHLVPSLALWSLGVCRGCPKPSSEMMLRSFLAISICFDCSEATPIERDLDTTGCCPHGVACSMLAWLCPGSFQRECQRPDKQQSRPRSKAGVSIWQNSKGFPTS